MVGGVLEAASQFKGGAVKALKGIVNHPWVHKVFDTCIPFAMNGFSNLRSSRGRKGKKHTGTPAYKHGSNSKKEKRKSGGWFTSPLGGSLGGYKTPEWSEETVMEESGTDTEFYGTTSEEPTSFTPPSRTPPPSAKDATFNTASSSFYFPAPSSDSESDETNPPSTHTTEADDEEEQEQESWASPSSPKQEEKLFSWKFQERLRKVGSWDSGYFSAF
ncbi:hypothetical protein HDV05_004026 [Chytridiales sp. JEL 0842]|nr:hypothetical protein HDV05_004026 [Chytridiales sp. JEL 0842]